MKLFVIKPILIGFIFLALTYGIYSNTLEAPFYFDDNYTIKDNADIRVTRITEVGNAGFKSSSTRPIAFISFALNYYFHQYNLKGYHLVNIIIHILTGIFLYLFIKDTLKLPLLEFKYHFLGSIAFFAALVWLVHPLHTQSVTYIVQRMNSMTAMFYVLSFWLYVRGRLVQENRKSWPWYVGSLLVWILALGSKQNAAVLPFFIFLYEWFFFQNLDRGWFKRHLKYVFGVVILFSLIALIYLGTNPLERLKSISDYANHEFTLTERILTQPRVVIYYISLIFFPHPSRLNLDYDFPLSHSLIDPITTLFSFCIIFGLIGFAIYIAKKERLISFCILWFFGNLVIESSVIPLAIIYEHRTYLPSMLVSLLAVLLGYRLIKIRWLGVALVFVVAAVFSFWTYQRNDIWRDPVALWSDCVAKSPQKARPHNNLGTALDKQGRTKEAIQHYLQALRIKPDYADAHNNLGTVLDKQGRTKEAIQHYLQALRIKPDYVDAHNNLGTVLDKQGRTKEAIQHYLQALRINPNFAEAHNNLGNVRDKQGRIKEAIQHYLQALRIKPDFADANYNLGNARDKQGRTKETIQHYLQALRLNPDYEKAHNNLGTVLDKQGRTEEAIQHYLQALRIKPDYADANYNLGNALYSQGRIEEAIQHYLQALRIKPDYENAHYNLGLALYKQGRTEEAIDHYLQALRIKPDYEKAHNNLGLALYKQGRTEEAIDHYLQALRIKPDYVDTHNNMGAALFRQGQIEKAVEHFKTALKIEPDYGDLRINLKKALALLKEIDGAIAEIQKALEITQYDPELYYNLGDLFYRKGGFDKAIAQYQKALSIQPEFVPALNRLAIIFSIRNENNKALSLFKQVVDLQPDSAETYYNIACMYSKKQKIAASIGWLKKAIKIGYNNWDQIKTDKDLENIRGSADFKALIKDK